MRWTGSALTDAASMWTATVPDAPIAQVDLEAELWRLSQRAEAITQKLAIRAREAAEADVTYKVAHAKALLQADGPAYIRDATATVATEDAYALKRTTEASLMAAQEAGRNCRAQLDSLRSINVNHRALVTGG